MSRKPFTPSWCEDRPNKWPRTASGWPSTSGTTASVAFIRKQKIYIGHVGDSGICLGYEDPSQSHLWMGQHLTRDHKPEGSLEKSRILRCGGKVVSKSGVPRVVWNRPKRGHKGPVRRSTPMDEIPFLAVARSLGDLWSYNPISNQFVVSPIPDVHVHPIDISTHRCLIFGTDGLWNVMSPYMAVNTAFCTEKNNEKHYLGIKTSCGTQRMWVNPSRSVVKGALDRYSRFKLRADNTSAIVVFLDPPGRPKREVLLLRKGLPTTKTLDEPASPATSNTANTNASADYKVQVHVYNLDKNTKTSSPKAPHGVLWIKERIPEKWQASEDSNTSLTPSREGNQASAEQALLRGSDGTKVLTPMQKGLSRAVAGDLGEQAPTPGSSEENLVRRTTDVPASASPLLSASLSNLSRHCSSSTTTPSGRSASSLHLPSNVALRSTVKVSSDSSGHSARLSLCSTTPTLRKSQSVHLRLTNTSTESEANCTASASPKAKSLSLNDMASATATDVCSSNKSLKRDRDDDDVSQPKSKKVSLLCSCGSGLVVHPSKNASSLSGLQSDEQERNSLEKNLGQSAFTCCGSCTSNNSSPKSLKLKAVQDSYSLTLRKRDDIQIPVISSSTLVSNKASVSNQPSSPVLVNNPDIQAGSLSASTRNIVKVKLKKSSSRVGSHESLTKNPIKRVTSENRRTRSGIPLSCSSLLPQSVATAINNNNTWCSDVKASTSRSSSRSACGSGDSEKTSTGQDKDLESGTASRVLKSVNRGSPNEANNKLGGLKDQQSTVMKGDPGKSSKYGKLLSPRRKRMHSVPCLSIGADVTAPPPKKKSAKMHLRSGKPMITRSQEKTCKNVRPK